MQIELEYAGQVGIQYPVGVAGFYAQAGEPEQAFTWLEKGYEKHAFAMTELKSDPNFDSLHSDPRWNDLLRRVGLPQ